MYHKGERQQLRSNECPRSPSRDASISLLQQCIVCQVSGPSHRPKYLPAESTANGAQRGIHWASQPLTFASSSGVTAAQTGIRLHFFGLSVKPESVSAASNTCFAGSRVLIAAMAIPISSAHARTTPPSFSWTSYRKWRKNGSAEIANNVPDSGQP